MRKLILLTMTAFLAVGAALLPSRSNALPIGSAADIRLSSDSLNLVEKAQFAYRGRGYCFYPDGWRGPGWYWCGYRLRRGFGWGGVYGWRGWRHPRYHRRYVRRPGIIRPRPGVRPRARVRPRAGVRPGRIVRPRAGVRPGRIVRPGGGVRPRAGGGVRPGGGARPRAGGGARRAGGGGRRR
ncbi:MAG: hypothetical protein GEU91_00815 [Rhizobiales bacterium]|nr:hypothetical protein [Hyphomicrobiales bacterium]